VTYKYRYIRRAIYEENPAGNLNSYRSLADIVRLYKRPFWIMLGVLLLAIVFLVITVVFNSKSPLIWIPSIIIILISMLSQIPRDKYFYNVLARADELSERSQDFKQYILDVQNILQRHGIDTPEKVQKLKTECEATLKIREDKYGKVNSKIVDMLIGVPLGALIASIIYAKGDAVPVAIGTLILIGLTFLGLVKLIKSINYYSEGYFKDKYLFDALNELDYSEKS
jgi:ElaB/YqjD/DUF883 family membrane-anchored ribosome-binding protein